MYKRELFLLGSCILTYCQILYFRSNFFGAFIMKVREINLFASSLSSVRLFLCTGEKTGLIKLFRQYEFLLKSDGNYGDILMEAHKRFATI